MLKKQYKDPKDLDLAIDCWVKIGLTAEFCIVSNNETLLYTKIKDLCKKYDFFEKYLLVL
jgi:hypothetical protein